ncbi:muconolactone Delta-isomerase family protein [Tellurirhabdus rosea]|uniref:muconolactone Delta-isomerase family protein n=1 Tax=Tellurirhabdus rosea TaxID=2674997 RepID=UPI002253EDF4|nr:muconolactone Delta-isomerase family protein [Tellurirhabdus rosea]
MSQFMIEFDLPQEMTEEFMLKIPAQRIKVNELMESGTILSYSLSMDRQKLWCVIKAQTEIDVMNIIEEFPLIDYMEPTISELMFNNIVSLRMPLFSLN